MISETPFFVLFLFLLSSFSFEISREITAPSTYEGALSSSTKNVYTIDLTSYEGSSLQDLVIELSFDGNNEIYPCPSFHLFGIELTDDYSCQVDSRTENTSRLEIPFLLPKKFFLFIHPVYRNYAEENLPSSILYSLSISWTVARISSQEIDLYQKNPVVWDELNTYQVIHAELEEREKVSDVDIFVWSDFPICIANSFIQPDEMICGEDFVSLRLSSIRENRCDFILFSSSSALSGDSVFVYLHQSECFECNLGTGLERDDVSYSFSSFGIKSHVEYEEFIGGLSWNYYRISWSGKENTVVELDTEDFILFACARDRGFPSFVSYEKISFDGVMELNGTYSYNLAVFNPFIHQKEYKIQSKPLKMVENSDTNSNSNGADTRVSIFIWTTVIICGGLLLICSVAFIVWARRSWKNLKSSGAWEMLRRSE